MFSKAALKTVQSAPGQGREGAVVSVCICPFQGTLCRVGNGHKDEVVLSSHHQRKHFTNYSLRESWCLCYKKCILFFTTLNDLSANLLTFCCLFLLLSLFCFQCFVLVFFSLDISFLFSLGFTQWLWLSRTRCYFAMFQLQIVRWLPEKHETSFVFFKKQRKVSRLIKIYFYKIWPLAWGSHESSSTGSEEEQ